MPFLQPKLIYFAKTTLNLKQIKNKIMDCNSPMKKKAKMSLSTPKAKRENDAPQQSSKRVKLEANGEPTVRRPEDIQAQRRRNFVLACEQASRAAYFDLRCRLQLIYLPMCTKSGHCKHLERNKNNMDLEPTVRQMSSYAEESIKIDIKSHTWCEAIEGCFMCITPTHYLSDNVLRDIVEIMLNAQHNEEAEYNITYLIDQCQQVLAQNFSTHPPCATKTMKKYYSDFLTSPMESKDQTFTNRSKFGCEKGIVKYCLNRLEFELSSDSEDGPIVNKHENIPEEMKDSVTGLYYQKEKFDIYEMLDRNERIQRLMTVLESLIELLQFDLVIWHTRHTSNLSSHIMRSNRPLMAYILWSQNILYTGTVTNSCRQILKLFVYLIHLEYQEKYVKIITSWVNVMIQTFYACETNSNSNYPNTGKYCASFSREFYKIIQEMPSDTVLRVLERIQPSFMQHLIGVIHIKTLLHTQEDDIIKIFINFLKKRQWELFTKSDSQIHFSNIPLIRPRKVKVVKYLLKKCKENLQSVEDCLQSSEEPLCQKLGKLNLVAMDKTWDIDQNYVLHVLYLTIEAYLDAYNIQSVQETLENLNKQLEESSCDERNNTSDTSYYVEEHFIKKYRSMFENMKQMSLLLQDIKDSLPDSFQIFKNLGFLE